MSFMAPQSPPPRYRPLDLDALMGRRFRSFTEFARAAQRQGRDRRAA